MTRDVISNHSYRVACPIYNGTLENSDQEYAKYQSSFLLKMISFNCGFSTKRLADFSVGNNVEEVDRIKLF